MKHHIEHRHETSIPWRKADESVSIITLTTKHGLDLFYYHLDQHGYHNLYDNLYAFLASLQGDKKGRIQSFDTEKELEEYIISLTY